MIRRKTFDCVEMKRRVQLELARENEGLTDEEQRARITRELASADDPVSRKWRALAEKTRPSTRATE